ncbi:MAG: FkbM family methyltransferase [Algoriphagus sp.]|jgi:FkbM family methyltransferase
MIVRKIKTLTRSLIRVLSKNHDKFLKEVSGVVHVGANLGQERELYSKHGLSVVWIEPIPEIFNQLQVNLQGHKNQLAYQVLVTELDGKEYEFHVANNGGASSSILELKEHKDIWPEVDYTKTISLRSITLSSLFEKEKIDGSKYQALILDTQGSELLVLRGSLPVLNKFKFIKVEVPDFESYEGCCQLSDINEFMVEHGYKEFSRNKFASRAEGGNYFDIVYKKQV